MFGRRGASATHARPLRRSGATNSAAFRISARRCLSIGSSSCRNGEFEGEIGRIVKGRFELALRLDFGGTLLGAYCRNGAPPSPLLDAMVRVRGVCTVYSNSQRQFQGVALSINRPSDVEVLQPPTRDPFDVPAQQIRQLFGFQCGAV